MAANGNGAAAPLDPLEQMGAVVNAPANSKEQADMLAALRDSLQRDAQAQAQAAAAAPAPEPERDFEGGFGGQEGLEDRYATTSGDH